MPTQPRSLSIEEIEAAAADFKEDLQRKANRCVRQDEGRDAYAAVLGQEYVEQFVYTLRMRAGSDFNRVNWPARARPIRLPKRGEGR